MPKIEFTDYQIMQIVGSPLGFESVCEELCADQDDVEEALLDVNIERCPGCDNFVFSHELIDENDDAVFCDECRRCDD